MEDRVNDGAEAVAGLVDGSVSLLHLGSVAMDMVSLFFSFFPLFGLLDNDDDHDDDDEDKHYYEEIPKSYPRASIIDTKARGGG